MRLFHVSEEPNITVFEPRLPSREDLDPKVGLVWALDEAHLPNFLTPRNCPRVTWHVGQQTTKADIEACFSGSCRHDVAIESAWFERMRNTTLYLYEFDPEPFVLQDAVAGYWVATTGQIPIARHVVSDLFEELFRRNVEIRILDTLWPLCRKIQASSLNWSMCRMAFAQKEE